jgi:hypothetical protein
MEFDHYDGQRLPITNPDGYTMRRDHCVLELGAHHDSGLR